MLAPTTVYELVCVRDGAGQPLTAEWSAGLYLSEAEAWAGTAYVRTYVVRQVKTVVCLRGDR